MDKIKPVKKMRKLRKALKRFALVALLGGFIFQTGMKLSNSLFGED